MELIDPQPCASSQGAVAHDAVPHLVEHDHQTEGLQFRAQPRHIVDQQPVRGVHVRGMREGIHAVDGVDLQRARRIRGLRLSQSIQTFRQIDQGRRGPVGLLMVLAVKLRDRAVDQAALGLVDAVRAADQRLDHVQHARAFAPDGIALGIVRVLDVERVDVIGGTFANLDALAAEPVSHTRA